MKTEEFNFENPDKRFFAHSDGIFFSKANATISSKTMQFLAKGEKEEWYRMDVFFDFKNQALAIKMNNETGRLRLNQSRRAFATGGFSSKAKRGRYKFLKKQDDMYIFVYSSER